MALIVPSFDNPYDPAHPLTDAYAWIAGLFLDLHSGNGRVVLNINPSEAAWNAIPVAQVSVSMGEAVVAGDANADPPVSPVVFPTLPELMSNPEFAQAFNTIGYVLYTLVAERCPVLSGATIQMPN